MLTCNQVQMLQMEMRIDGNLMFTNALVGFVQMLK
ncbi:hypothetical protein T03_8173 [Trichinella britovi]|uniref:Uncharacterized protein n=1 Tax=Trichinella britovi TaxID=45882 RepID=A0A0V1AHZ8_TRIBR|nr:hypothetical protein T03_8173 [Trichinella britovi]